MADGAYSGLGDIFGELGGNISDSLGGVYGDTLGQLFGNGGLFGDMGPLSNVLSALTGGGSGTSSLLSSLLGSSGGSGGGSNANLLGAILGGLAGYTNGAQQSGTIDVTQSPWGPAQPYLTSGFEQAKNDLASQQAFGTSLLPGAQAELGKTISGDYLNPETNPYLKGAVEDALGLAKAGLGSAFQGNNYGNSAHQEWLGRTLANTALPYYMNNYNTERTNQLNAATTTPQFYQGAFGAMSAPTTNYINTVGKGYGSTTSQPYFTNPLGGALSGALFGSQLGGLFG